MAALSAQCRQQGVLSRGRGLGGDGSWPGLQEYRDRRQSSAAAWAGSPQNRCEVRVICRRPKPWVFRAPFWPLWGAARRFWGRATMLPPRFCMLPIDWDGSQPLVVAGRGLQAPPGCPVGLGRLGRGRLAVRHLCVGGGEKVRVQAAIQSAGAPPRSTPRRSRASDQQSMVPAEGQKGLEVRVLRVLWVLQLPCSQAKFWVPGEDD